MRRQNPRSVVDKAIVGARYRYGRRDGNEQDWDQAADETFRRFVADWCEFWRRCGYFPCLRAGRCRRDGAPCFSRDIEETSSILFGSKSFRELYEAAAEIVDELDFNAVEEEEDEDEE